VSVKVIGWVWGHSRSRGSERLVLLAIADHCDHDGRNAYPRMAGLAQKTGLSERTVRRSIRALEALGELVVEMNTGGNGQARPDHRPNAFQVVLPHDTAGGHIDPPRTADGGSDCPPVTYSRGVRLAGTGGQIVPPTGGHIDPPNKEEPSLRRTVLEPSLGPAAPPPAAAPPKRGAAKAARAIVARALVTEWWEERQAAGNPPAQRFVAVLGVVDGVLANGVDAEAVGWALRNAPTVSGGAIQMALSRRNGTGYGQSPSTTDTALRMIRDGRRP
jgi:hypothetical protein